MYNLSLRLLEKESGKLLLLWSKAGANLQLMPHLAHLLPKPLGLVTNFGSIAVAYAVA